jgi:hypothetical protein
MRVYIRGKSWDLQFVPRLKLDGLAVDGTCDPPGTPNKRIRIRKGLKGRDLIETIIHEVLHAGCWDLDEMAVREMSADAARILERLSEVGR